MRFNKFSRDDPDDVYYITDAGYTAWESYRTAGLQYWVSLGISSAIGFTGLVLSLISLLS